MTDLNQLSVDVAHLREDVDYLTALAEFELVAGANSAVTKHSPTPSPASGRASVWHGLTPREAADAWAALTGWVDWLVDRFGLDDMIPTCWYRHGPLVEELDAIRAAWVGSYLDQGARLTEASEWLEALARTLVRIREWDRYGCAAGTHHDHLPPVSVPAALDERETYLQDDIAMRLDPRTAAM